MIILGLGSNIGDRMRHLEMAVTRLSVVISDIRCSHIFESKAILPPDATPDMDRPFYNMAIRGNANLPPPAMFEQVKYIEKELGRVERCFWGPREIDIDILAIDELVMQNKSLCIPHAELLNRDFVLIPLQEIAPDWGYPVQGVFYKKKPKQIIEEKGYKQSADLRDTGLRIGH